MMILAFKLFLTPIFIGSVTLAGRRWGPVVSGLLMGLPLTSGPISFIIAHEYGLDFASKAAIGGLVGQASVCIFCLAYSLAAQKNNWMISAVISIAFFLITTAIWNKFSWLLLTAFAVLIIIIGLVARFIPKNPLLPALSILPAWDLPARMIIAAIFVLLLTTFANKLGPQLSGLISPFPVFGLVLAVFTQRQQGAHATANLLRGVVLGSVSFAFFFLVIGLLLTNLGAALTYLIASIVAILVSGVFYAATR